MFNRVSTKGLSFFKLHHKFPKRVKIERTLESKTLKMQRKRKFSPPNFLVLRFDHKCVHFVTNHPYRTVFLCIGSFIMHYFEIDSWFYEAIFNGEPKGKKLRRWILDENNYPMDSIIETNEGHTPKFLSESSQRALERLYHTLDNRLYYGVSFKIVMDILENYKVFEENKREESNFLRKHAHFNLTRN